MSWRELLGQEILIRIPDNDIGFVYVVKYGGVTVRRGFVPVIGEEHAEGGKPFARHEAVENDTPDGD